MASPLVRKLPTKGESPQPRAKPSEPKAKPSEHRAKPLRTQGGRFSPCVRTGFRPVFEKFRPVFGVVSRLTKLSCGACFGAALKDQIRSKSNPNPKLYHHVGRLCQHAGRLYHHILESCASMLEGCASMLESCASMLEGCASMLEGCANILESCASMLEGCVQCKKSMLKGRVQYEK